MTIIPKRIIFRVETGIIKNKLGVNAKSGESFERYMTVEELCLYLSVTRETVYRWIKQNKLPALRVGKRWMFQRVEIDNWVKADRVI